MKNLILYISFIFATQFCYGQCPLEKLVGEINNNTQLKNAIKDNPDIIKYFDDVLANTNLNKHIFEGEPKIVDGRIRNVKGVHSKEAINIPDTQTSNFNQGDIRFKEGTKNPVDASPDDYYTSKVEIYGKRGDGQGNWNDGWINKKSTFFPDSWSVEKIQAEIAHAMGNKQFDRIAEGAEIFRGTATDGTIIEIVIRDEIVRTVYPVI